MVDEKPTEKRKKKNDPSNVYKKAIDKILEENSDEEVWVKLSLIGNRLKSQYPEFDPKNYGYRKTTDYIKELGMRKGRSLIRTTNRVRTESWCISEKKQKEMRV